MDPDRRAALLKRREKLRHDLHRNRQLAGLEDLRAGLASAGETFEILYRGEVPEWTPGWIPRGYSRIPWHLTPAAEETWFKKDIRARNAAFAHALARVAEPHEELLFVFEGHGASFRMARTVAERHVALILRDRASSLAPVWVTSPPGQWLIEVSSDTVRIGDALASGIYEAHSDRIGRAAFETIRTALDEGGEPYVAFRHDDPERPELPNILCEDPIPPLRMTIPAADDRLVRSTVLGFVEQRVAPSDPVQLIFIGAPRIQLSRAAFEPLFDILYASAADFNVSGPRAGWAVSVSRRSRTWIEGTG